MNIITIREKLKEIEDIAIQVSFIIEVTANSCEHDDLTAQELTLRTEHENKRNWLAKFKSQIQNCIFKFYSPRLILSSEPEPIFLITVLVLPWASKLFGFITILILSA